MKKMKLDFYTFANAYHYYDYARKGIVVNGKKRYGTLYWLCNPLTNEQKEDLLRHKNVRLYISEFQYAPEIKHNVVMLFDVCI